MTEVKIFAIYLQFLGEFTANLKNSYSQAYSPICESSITNTTITHLLARLCKSQINIKCFAYLF